MNPDPDPVSFKGRIRTPFKKGSSSPIWTNIYILCFSNCSFHLLLPIQPSNILMKSEQKDTNLLMRAEKKTLVMEYDILKRVSSCALRHNTEGRNVTLLLLVYTVHALFMYNQKVIMYKTRLEAVWQLLIRCRLEHPQV